MAKNVFLIGLGSGFGGILRFFISYLLKNEKFFGFPLSVFLVNIVGCFIIGLCFSLLKEKIIDNTTSIFLMTGILGGFTTFSSFSLEILQFFQNNEPMKAIFYGFGTTFLGFLACFLGYKVYYLF
ncbi:MAG: fluoride efflux transporter CrcB [Capnocytophaga sp.]|nr:fluoride efflux transporter CrcB [Capnocytophaga sp.]